ncbi:MAG: DNA primase [Oscillospiraceae bacterium]|nr:DNA primase [Oscillospiraceae bacterium]
MQKNTFPTDLTALPQWVGYKLEPDKTGRVCKIPYNPHNGKKASSTDSQTWGTFEQAVHARELYNFSGIGFVFTEDCGIVGIDIDHCLDSDGNSNAIAADIIARLPPTYIEFSPSKTGLHIFLKGTLPKGGNRNSATGVEIYSNARYFTMTGNRHPNCVDSIADDNGVLAWIHSTYVATPKLEKSPKKQSATTFDPLTITQIPDDKVLEMARKSKDGGAFDKLYSGDWQGAYKSQSEADFALCCKLAFWTGKVESQMDRLFRQSGLMREKWGIAYSDGLTYGAKTILNACNATTAVYTAKPHVKPTSQNKSQEIFVEGGCYFRRKGDKFYQITNFTVNPDVMIISDDEAQLTCEFVTEGGEKFPQALLSSDFSTLAKLRGVLNKNTIALSFMGGESDLELFKIHLYSLKWTKKRGVKAIGIYPRSKAGKLIFVDTTGAVGVGGRRVTDTVQMERFKVLESNILNADLITVDALRTLSVHILNYNEPAKTIPILAWVCGCFIKPHLRRVKIKFPHLFAIGEAGSGKSNTLERIIQTIFSRTKVTASGQVTAFTLMRESNSSNIFPQAFDEFKPSKIDRNRLNWLYNHFRDSYDCHEGVRGRADQTAVTYDLLAPICVVGEESPEESAIRERSIELLFSKRDISQNSEQRDSFIWLTQNEKTLNALGRSLLDSTLDTTVAEVEQWFIEGKEFFASGLPLRVLDNLCCLYAGLCLLRKLCGRLNLPWVFPFDIDSCTKYIEFAAKEYLLDGGLSNKSIVEQAFEVMSRMPLKHGNDYIFENNNQFLCLHLAGIYDKYTRYRRDCAILGEVLTYSQFKKQLQFSEFFVEKNRTKRFGDETKKVWIIDFHKLFQQCDVAGFEPPKPLPVPHSSTSDNPSSS